MKDLSIIIPTVNLTNITRSPNSTSLPCSPTASCLNKHAVALEYDGCMLCTNGTPSCLQKRRATWTLKLRVALYCLSVLNPDKKYFNLKKDIYTYVDNHWDLLSINTAKSDRWRKQVQDSLSHCRHFESGWDAMGCNGHWRLIQPLNPWSFPPEKEASIMEEDGDYSSYTPESSLSPRPTKSPREDPLYRNFPKRRSIVEMSSNNDDMDNRKRKADNLVHELPTEEELIMLKYSPMIFSDTPSPKCRTPRGSNQQSTAAPINTTSPSIIGSSPMMTSGNYFSLSNFSNNLTLNNNNNNNINHSNNTTNITNLEANNSNNILHQQQSRSPCSSPSLISTNNNKSTPPIPGIPFSWKTSTTPTLNSGTNSISSYSPLKTAQPTPNDSNEIMNIRCITPRESKVIQNLSNPFAQGPSSPKFTTSSGTLSPSFFSGSSNNSTLKVPSELLLKTTTTNDRVAISSLATSSTNNSPPSSPNSTSNNLTKIQQQNLILNCTY